MAQAPARIGTGQRTMAVPTRRHLINPDPALGIEQPETASDGQNRRNQRDRDRDRDEHAHCARDAQGVKVGQPGEAQTQNRPGDRQTGSQDNGRDAAICGVVGRFTVLAGLTRLLIATKEKYPVVGSGRHPKGHQEIGSNRRETKEIRGGRDTRRFPGLRAIRFPP